LLRAGPDSLPSLFVLRSRYLPIAVSPYRALFLWKCLIDGPLGLFHYPSLRCATCLFGIPQHKGAPPESCGRVSIMTTNLAAAPVSLAQSILLHSFLTVSCRISPTASYGIGSLSGGSWQQKLTRRSAVFRSSAGQLMCSIQSVTVGLFLVRRIHKAGPARVCCSAPSGRAHLSFMLKRRIWPLFEVGLQRCLIS